MNCCPTVASKISVCLYGWEYDTAKKLISVLICMTIICHYNISLEQVAVTLCYAFCSLRR
jgi:hypothetical protein